MRPVNLIPPEDRRGESAPSRTGGLAYLIVGALAVVLAGVVGIVMLDNKVADRESEAVGLEAELTSLEARAESLTSFVTLQGIRDARVETVDSLARSRFDWERVLRELSLVVPDGVWLTNLNGSVSPAVQSESGDGGNEFRASIPGPALELTGCGRSHSDVARLVAAMEDIDGVTRVTASNSAKPDSETTGAGDGTCQTRSSIAAFNLIAAFDEVPVVAGSAATPVPTPPPAGVPAEAGSDGGVAAAESQRTASQGEIDAAAEESEKTSNLVPGG